MPFRHEHFDFLADQFFTTIPEPRLSWTVDEDDAACPVDDQPGLRHGLQDPANFRLPLTKVGHHDRFSAIGRIAPTRIMHISLFGSRVKSKFRVSRSRSRAFRTSIVKPRTYTECLAPRARSRNVLKSYSFITGHVGAYIYVHRWGNASCWGADRSSRRG